MIEFKNRLTGTLMAVARSIASSALDTIKDFFGIASPSRVMRDEAGRRPDQADRRRARRQADRRPGPEEESRRQEMR